MEVAIVRLGYEFWWFNCEKFEMKMMKVVIVFVLFVSVVLLIIIMIGGWDWFFGMSVVVMSLFWVGFYIFFVFFVMCWLCGILFVVVVLVVILVIFVVIVVLDWFVCDKLGFFLFVLFEDLFGLFILIFILV